MDLLVFSLFYPARPPSTKKLKFWTVFQEPLKPQLLKSWCHHLEGFLVFLHPLSPSLSISLTLTVSLSLSFFLSHSFCLSLLLFLSFFLLFPFNSWSPSLFFYFDKKFSFPKNTSEQVFNDLFLTSRSSSVSTFQWLLSLSLSLSLSAFPFSLFLGFNVSEVKSCLDPAVVEIIVF